MISSSGLKEQQPQRHNSATVGSELKTRARTELHKYDLFLLPSRATATKTQGCYWELQSLSKSKNRVKSMLHAHQTSGE